MRLEVQTSRSYRKRMRGTYAFSGVPTFVVVVAAYSGLRRDHLDEALIMLAFIPFVWLLPLVFWWARRYTVETFDAGGVSLFSGRRFAWGNFKSVKEQVRHRMRQGYELHFTDGIAYVEDLRADNYTEVSEVIAELARGENRFIRG